MGMKAVFECDECGAIKVISGNIVKSVPHMVTKGWVAGKEVLCPEHAPVAKEKPVVAPRSNTVTEVYTDGSCVGTNPGFGGWGWSNGIEHGSGPAEEYPSTNQRMEIQAAFEGLKNNFNPVRLITDSRYVVDCIQKGWYKGWVRNGWRTAGKQPVKNQDLWVRLVAELEKHPDLEVQWVKGHVGNAGNEKADDLAQAAARELQSKGKPRV